jgi:hypothetical protein
MGESEIPIVFRSTENIKIITIMGESEIPIVLRSTENIKIITMMGESEILIIVRSTENIKFISTNVYTCILSSATELCTIYKMIMGL